MAANITDYRELARRRLPKFLFEYIDGGSYDELTLARNRSDLQAIALRQRVLRDVSKIDLTTSLFGQALDLPVALAPIGLGGLNARRGEIQAARAAEAAGVPFCLSTVAACSIGEVAASVKTPVWFQLYMVRDRAFMIETRHVFSEIPARVASRGADYSVHRLPAGRNAGSKRDAAGAGFSRAADALGPGTPALRCRHSPRPF